MPLTNPHLALNFSRIARILLYDLLNFPGIARIPQSLLLNFPGIARIPEITLELSSGSAIFNLEPV